MTKLIFVALGGGAGAVARYLVGMGALRSFGPGWPVGTLTVNVVGGLAMGLLAGWLAHRGGADQERWRLLLGVGVLGGFTTFSSFSMEFWMLFERGQTAQAAAYVLASVIGAIAACGLGLFLMRQVPA